jgi:chemosensory pili system protein ChpA (sensor histidine kinase/response regulator)
MNPVMELDIAPLSWVRAEIDAALAKALEAIEKAIGGGSGSESLRFAQTHVHQVQGALALVGLDGVTQFAEATDALLRDLADGKLAFDDPVAELLQRALIALGNYLAEIQEGSPHQPLRLYPLFAELSGARGADVPAKSELFFPDLAARIADIGNPIEVAPERAAHELRLLRGRFEKGLLTWLRTPAADSGPAEMLSAVGRIAQLNAAPSTRAFWWAAIAFFEGLTQHAIASDREAQRLCRRIDTQMRRLLEGSLVVAERLVRDVLFHVANSRLATEHAQAVRSAFRLDALLPSEETERVAETPLAPLRRGLRDALENSKEAWNRFIAGAAIGLPQLQEQLAAARSPLSTLGMPDLLRLINAIDKCVSWLRKDPLQSNDEIAMDVATALLVAERAIDAAGGEELLSRQVEILAERLATWESGKNPGPLDDQIFGDDSRRAQEKLFFNQLAREILTTLGQVEQTLDAYFRNPKAQSESLAGLSAPLKQLEGAFAMLEEHDAAALVRENAARIAQLLETEDTETCEKIAHELSALGFFVEALRHGPARLERFLVAEGGAVSSEEPVTVESEVRQRSREAQQKLEALAAQPADEKLKAELKQNLETLREDAALLNDAKLEKQTREALSALKTGQTSDKVKEAVSSLAPAAAPSADATRLIEASEEQVDAELLEIFLEEAHEVLGTISTHREALERAPHDHESIVTVRRGFHTFKGSSRMVGLNDFSDAAKAVEFAMNRWLQQERDAGPELLTLVDHAVVLIDAWVAQLEAGGSTWMDASALIAEAERISAWLDSGGTDRLPAAPLVEAVPAVSESGSVFAEPAAESQELVALDLELEGGDVELDAPGSSAEPAPELETMDLTSTLLSPFSEMGAEGEAVQEGESALLPPLDELGVEQADAESEQTLDLTSSLVGGDELDALLSGREPVAETGEKAEEPEFLFEELSLSDEDMLPDEARPQAEEEIDLTATLLAPLALRDALYGAPEEEEEAPEPELPSLNLTEAVPVSEAPLPEALAEVEQEAVEAPALEDIVLEEIEAPEVATHEADNFAEPEPEPEPEPVLAAAVSELPALEEPSEEIEAETLAELEALDQVAPASGGEEAEALAELDVSLEPPLNEREEMLEFDGIDATESAEATELELSTVGEPEPVLEEEAEADTVQIGEVNISRTLFELYVAEAHQHAETLRQELPRFAANPVLVPEEPVIRAAHTLGGISGTARIESIRTLAKALEHALARLHLEDQAPNLDQAELIRATGERLQAMVVEVGDRQMPLGVPELVEELERMTRPAEIERVQKPVVSEFFPSLESAAEPEQWAAEPTAEAVAVAEMEAETLEQSESAELAEAARQAEAAPIPEKAHAVVRDDLDEQLLPIFFEEADELAHELSGAVRELRDADAAGTEESAKAVARLLHTLKGSARMAGAMTLGEFVHGIENKLLIARDKAVPGALMADELDQGLDIAGQMIARMQAGEPAALPVAGEDQPQASVEARGPVEALSVAVTGVDEVDSSLSQRAILRVRSELVDRFVNEAGEIAIARTRIEGELRTLRRSMLDLTENVIRLRNQLREIEIAAETQMVARNALVEQKDTQFDPLEIDRFTRFQELTRMMAESVGDVTTIQQNLLRNLDAADSSLHAQGRLSRDLQQSLMGVRMVPFDEQAERLYRVVRQTAKELGKRANLDIRGGQIEIDRSVLDKMTAPIEHLLRNAVAHGLESPDERRAAGKEEIGQITLTVTQRSNEVALELADDGKGLNYEAIRSRAEANGMVAADDVITESRLTQMIFEPGFSTAEKVSEVAGRGVGMDVVKSATMDVGGRIEVASESGQGTRFIVHLPLTLAVTQALLVKAGERTYAIPSNMVEQVLELRQADFEALLEKGFVDWKEKRYPLGYLPRLLGDTRTQPVASRFQWVLLLRSGPDLIALHVDELRGNQEVVVKNAGPQFTRLQGFSGATVLPDGEISLILNPVVMAGSRIASIAMLPAAQEQARAQAQPAAPDIHYVPTVMVVDDSLTVRKITSRLLEREGYNVVTAKDGVDALEQLVETMPDVMLLDIEMPRMDGFELTRNIRGDERLKPLPIIMITSRMADKHRNYAFELGVNEYLGKPYNEQDLLGRIKELVKR